MGRFSNNLGVKLNASKNVVDCKRYKFKQAHYKKLTSAKRMKMPIEYLKIR